MRSKVRRKSLGSVRGEEQRLLLSTDHRIEEAWSQADGWFFARVNALLIYTLRIRIAIRAVLITARAILRQRYHS